MFSFYSSLPNQPRVCNDCGSHGFLLELLGYSLCSQCVTKRREKDFGEWKRRQYATEKTEEIA